MTMEELKELDEPVISDSEWLAFAEFVQSPARISVDEEIMSKGASDALDKIIDALLGAGIRGDYLKKASCEISCEACKGNGNNEMLLIVIDKYSKLRRLYD